MRKHTHTHTHTVDADGYENSNINAFAFIGHGSEWKGYAADFRDLCYLLTCTSVTEVPSLRNWGGRSGEIVTLTYLSRAIALFIFCGVECT